MIEQNDAMQSGRIPGLFRSWELGQVLRPGTGYWIEAAGETADGFILLAIFRLPGESAGRSEAG